MYKYKQTLDVEVGGLVMRTELQTQVPVTITKFKKESNASAE